jgi:hypothetical protein
MIALGLGVAMVAATIATAVPAGAKTTDAVCDPSGVLTFNPQLQGYVQAIGVTVQATSLSCHVGGHGSGSIAGVLPSPYLYCNVDTSFQGTSPTGVLIVTWQDSSTSRLRVTLSDPYVSQGVFLFHAQGQGSIRRVRR